jgi:hypothetical protein
VTDRTEMAAACLSSPYFGLLERSQDYTATMREGPESPVCALPLGGKHRFERCVPPFDAVKLLGFTVRCLQSTPSRPPLNSQTTLRSHGSVLR